MADEIRELIQLRHNEQTRYAYFLLAAAASAIALVINQTQTATFRWPMVVLAAAVAFWLSSFLCGCLYLRTRFSFLAVNVEILKIQKESGSYFRKPIEELTATHGKLRDMFSEVDKTATAYARGQFWGLVAGACLYLAWHVLGIAIRTAAA